MTTHVRGFTPPDENWRKMKAVYDACEAADMKIPQDVVRFFNYDPPDPRGLEVKLDDCLLDWGDEGRWGYELDLSKLPPQVKFIRFYNSW